MTIIKQSTEYYDEKHFNFIYLKFLFVYFHADNPLICDCELAWYEAWLAGLRDRDDEMMQKKRTVCTMVNEHREYSVAKMPLEKMSCKRKPPFGRTSSSPDTCPAFNAATHILLVIATRWF